MEKGIVPFDFKQCIILLKSTGKSAGSLQELRDILSIINEESIFHHMHQYFLKGHILEYTNDFAQWAGESLEESALSEHLSNIDPFAFGDAEELRNRLVAVMDDYIAKMPGHKEVLPGSEFYFNQTITMIFPSEIRVKNLAEFLIAIKYVDGSSIYYHFYEARTRLGGADDFTQWFEEALGKRELAEKVRAIDLFMHPIEGIRRHIADTVEEEVRRDMHGATETATVFK